MSRFCSVSRTVASSYNTCQQRSRRTSERFLASARLILPAAKYRCVADKLNVPRRRRRRRSLRVQAEASMPASWNHTTLHQSSLPRIERTPPTKNSAVSRDLLSRQEWQCKHFLHEISLSLRKMFCRFQVCVSHSHCHPVTMIALRIMIGVIPLKNSTPPNQAVLTPLVKSCHINIAHHNV